MKEYRMVRLERETADRLKAIAGNKPLTRFIGELIGAIDGQTNDDLIAEIQDLVLRLGYSKARMGAVDKFLEMGVGNRHFLTMMRDHLFGKLIDGPLSFREFLNEQTEGYVPSSDEAAKMIADLRAMGVNVQLVGEDD